MKLNIRHGRNIASTFTFLILLVMLAYLVLSLPVGPTITSIKNSTITSSGAVRTDAGGYIHTVNINTLQQNYAWKAYVGNVTGLFTLDDASGATIYNWVLPEALVSGEIYVTRNTSVDFPSINCSNVTIFEQENSHFGFSQADRDSINSTFNLTLHAGFSVGAREIIASTCKSLFTFIGDTYQAESVNSNFSEVLLADNRYSLIYATILETDATGFDNATFDFQMIVPENDSVATPTTYYFYVEIGS